MINYTAIYTEGMNNCQPTRCVGECVENKQKKMQFMWKIRNMKYKFKIKIDVDIKLKAMVQA